MKKPAIFAGLLLIGLIYLFNLRTGDIQEDAFILFRTACNIADHGQWTFNLGEHHNAATSFLYPLLVALVRLVAGEATIPAVLTLNTLVVLLSAYGMAKLIGALTGKRESPLPVWAFVALTPMALHMAVRGMEAVYVAGFFVLGLGWIHSQPDSRKTGFPIFILPFIRPDAIAFSLILALFLFVKSSGRNSLGWAAAAAGLALLLAFNALLFGHPIPATIQAKALAQMPPRTLGVVAKDVFSLFAFSPFFSPVTSKYLEPGYPAMSALALLLSALLLRTCRTVGRPCLLLSAAILAGIWLVPAAYALGGIVNSWYLWPSQFAGQGLLAGMLVSGWIHAKSLTRRLLFPFLLLVIGFSGFQLILSISKGAQESGYRASVGKYLKTQAAPGATLFLEPAGYIPYFSGLRTIDEVGLASPIILSYIKRFPDRWWVEAVMNEQPDFLVQRDHILAYTTYQGYVFTAGERAWFDAHYSRVKSFHYRAEDFSTHPLIQRILRMGGHTDYHVYQKRTVTP